MSRSPNDATRFTATGPHATSKASSSTSSGSRIDFGTAPANETPQQKIARLRAAAQQAKLSKEDRFDKVVRVGRVWADRAHKFTGYSLMALTVVSVVIGVAGTTDMILHNRARRRDWYKEQELKRQAAIIQATRALAAGTITQDQKLLLAQERAKLDAEEARKNRPGMIKRSTNWLFGGWSKEEQKGGRIGAAAAAALEKSSDTISQAKESIVEQLQNNQVESMVSIPASNGETAQTIHRGGILDQQAQQLANATIQEAKSWRSWLTRS